MSERRGTIERTETGWTVKPAVWSEHRTAPSPEARLSVGRMVRVTFDFIVTEEATRAELLEQVEDELNGMFDLVGEPVLEDLALRTDRPQLMEEALTASTAQLEASRNAR